MNILIVRLAPFAWVKVKLVWPAVAVTSSETSIIAVEASIELDTFPAPIVVAKLPVPDPVTSPVRVMVWSPVFVPETVASEETVKVLPSAIVNVALVVGDVIVTLFIVELNVFAPAKVCVPVVTKPLAVALASGILNVCVVLELEILKSEPEVPVANV